MPVVITAIEEFKEKFHKNRIYKANEPYPAKGFKADPERIEELSTSKNKYGRPFLHVSESESKEEPKKEKPKK